jgi:hypothetical protein
MHDNGVTGASALQVDWKALGYIVSIVSVFFLGAIAWPKPNDPWWHEPALIIGMATSVVGMGFRYKAHLDQKREIRKAKAEAEHAEGKKGTTSSTRPPGRRESPTRGRR